MYLSQTSEVPITKCFILWSCWTTKRVLKTFYIIVKLTNILKLLWRNSFSFLTMVLQLGGQIVVVAWYQFVVKLFPDWQTMFQLLIFCEPHDLPFPGLREGSRKIHTFSNEMYLQMRTSWAAWDAGSTGRSQGLWTSRLQASLHSEIGQHQGNEVLKFKSSQN